MKPLQIGLSLAATWLHGDGWKRPDSRVDELFSLSLYNDLARQAEAVGLDFLFKPDSLSTSPERLAENPGVASLDPIALLSSLAAVTTHIRLVATVSTAFTPPFIVARQLQSLHHLSNGRAGWNIVTSIDGFDNVGATPPSSSAERYTQAEEFLDVVQQLWRSFPTPIPAAISASESSPALTSDPSAEASTPTYATGVHRINHPLATGPLNVPQHTAGEIPLFQAGSSPSGREFAAANASAIFAATPTLDAALELRQDLSRRAHHHGRPSDAIRVLPGCYFFLARTKAEATELFQQTHAGISNAQKFDYIYSLVGVDLRDHALDAPVLVPLPTPTGFSSRSATHAALLLDFIEKQRPTLRELLNAPEVVSSAHWVVIGTADDAVTEIVRWAEAEALDGLIALPGGSLGSLDIFLTHVVPALRELELFFLTR